MSGTLRVPAVLLALDAEKVFDSIEWPYMMAILRKMGFDPSSDPGAISYIVTDRKGESE